MALCLRTDPPSLVSFSLVSGLQVALNPGDLIFMARAPVQREEERERKEGGRRKKQKERREQELIVFVFFFFFLSFFYGTYQC